MTPDDTRRIFRAPLVAGLLVLLVGGCERITDRLGVTGNVEAVEPEVISPELLSVSLPVRGAQATLGPVARNGDVTVWQTLDGITLSLRSGLLIGTRGLGEDLMSADVDGTLRMLREPATPLYHLHVRTYLDGEDGTVYRRYQCREVKRADTGVDILGEDLPAIRVDVGCVSPRDEMVNTYWIDRSGAVLKSRQFVSPTLGYMEIAPAPTVPLTVAVSIKGDES